jgi:hypothetical protein
MIIKYITGDLENVRISSIKEITPKKQGAHILFKNGTEGMASTIGGYKVFPYFKRLYVVKQATDRKGTVIPDADFMGTGMALCAVLKEGMFLKFLKNEI